MPPANLGPAQAGPLPACSKLKLQAQLYLARPILHARYTEVLVRQIGVRKRFASGSTLKCKLQIALVVVVEGSQRVVQDVERREPELKISLLSRGKVLEHRHIVR
jgi:hypothetical protein